MGSSNCSKNTLFPWIQSDGQFLTQTKDTWLANFTNSCHCKNVCHPKICSKIFWKKKNKPSIWNIFSWFTILSAGSEASYSHSTGRGTIAWSGVRREEQNPAFQQLLATILAGDIKQHHKLIPITNHFAFQIDFLSLPSGKPFILCKTGVKHYQM